MEDWYVLYVRTGSEEKVKDLLTKLLDQNYHLPFIPMKAKIFRRHGVINKDNQICFPGYVFIKSKYRAHEFIKEVLPVVHKIKEAYLFLHYGDKYDVAMRECEKKSMNNLLGSNFCIESSIGFIEGDAIRIISGGLMWTESTIKKINRHKREAIIEVNIMGDIRQVSVVLEVMEKI